MSVRHLVVGVGIGVSAMISVPIGRTKTGRRSLTVAYKVEFLQAWDEAIERGAKTRLLRENDLQRNTVIRWIAARDRGQFSAAMTAAATELPRSKMDNRDRAELLRLRQENERLKRKVVQAEAAQEILGKAFELLDGITKSSSQDDQEPQIPPALMSAEQYAQWLQRNNIS
jgi:hypothetical protein